MNEKRNFVIGIGELLWDMLPEGKRCGGAPANVVYHLTKLGINSALVSAVGRDSDGDELLDFLRSRGVCVDYISRNELPSGTVQVTLSDGIPQYEICRNVAWDHIICPEELQKRCPEITAAVFGSLSQRDPVSGKNIRDFLTALPDSCLKVFDINLRQNFYSEDLLRRSMEICNILKINEEELDIVAEMFQISGTRKEVVRTLAEQYSLQAVILTLGADGSMLFDGKSFTEYPVIPCKIVDTVGCGDSFLAAWLASFLRGNSMEDAMAAGTKLSSEVACQAGAIPG